MRGWSVGWEMVWLGGVRAYERCGVGGFGGCLGSVTADGGWVLSKGLGGSVRVALGVATWRTD